MLIEYFRMKRNEFKLKNTIYSAVNIFFAEKKDMVDLIHKLYIALKDTPAEELKDEIVKNVGSMIYEQSMKENSPN